MSQIFLGTLHEWFRRMHSAGLITPSTLAKEGACTESKDPLQQKVLTNDQSPCKQGHDVLLCP